MKNAKKLRLPFCTCCFSIAGLNLERFLNLLAKEGYNPEFGARPVKRAIHRLVLNELSKDILAQKVNRDKPIVIDANGETLNFRN